MKSLKLLLLANTLLVFGLLVSPKSIYAQTVIFQSGFEAADPVFTYATDGGSGTCSNVTAAPRSGTRNGRLINGGSNGSIITPLLTFAAGKYYSVEVYSKRIKCNQSLDIRKSATATNTAMTAATGADIILNGTTNVTLTTYSLFTGWFLGTGETKYIGFQMINGNCGGGGISTQDLDDIRITEYDVMPCGYYCTQGGNTLGSRYIASVIFNMINRISGFDGYACTGVSTPVERTLSYDLTVLTPASASVYYSAAWIDWNGDGDFIDGGENVMASAVHTGTTRVQSVAVPAGATLGITKMRVKTKFNAAITGPCEAALANDDVEDYDIDILPAPVPMTFVSCNTTQVNTSPVDAGTYQNEIIGLEIVTAGSLSPISATSFNFTTNGTTNATNDLLNAQLWYTAGSSTFATTTQVGTIVANPNGSFSFTGTVQLASGTNYFWLTYDVKFSATAPDVVDATCTSATVAGTPQTPTVTNPAGNRPIVDAVPMVFISSTVTQNVSRSPRPDTDHHILGVEIVMDGAGSPLQATSFTFNTTGTSAIVTGNIANAKLWFTGFNGTFATNTQVGTTLAAPNGVFTITQPVTLFSGTNYFWLTYDILPGAGCDPVQADAQCTSLTVDGIPRTPTVTAPLGAVVIDCNAGYFSKGNLPVNLPSSFNSNRDGTGTDATIFDAASIFYVQNGHTMPTTAAITIPYLTLEAGGRVNASYLVSSTDLRINGYGIFEQIVQAINGNFITNFFIENYGTWIHNNTGYLPNQNRYFSPESNQWFYQWGGGTFPPGTAWGNVLLNGTTPGNFGMGYVLTTIQGDFEWRRIGSGNYLLDEANETINIAGDLIFSGGWWKVAYDNSLMGNQVRTVVINVAGNFIMTSGTLEDYARGAAASGATLNVNGDVTITGGILNFNLSPGGASPINLTVGNPSMNWSQTGGTVTLGNTNVKTGKTAFMTGARIGNVAASRTVTVETGAQLYTSNFPVTGTGNFTLQTGAHLGIGSIAGITSTGATGNIQVSGTRSYNSGATYEYYEGLTPQATGNFLTTTTNATYPSQVANLIINKATPTQLVNLTNTTNVTGTMTLASGILNTSLLPATAPWVRIPSTATVSPVGGSQNSYVDGFIRRQGATDFIFPTGNNGLWRRIAVTTPSVSTEFEARYIAAPYTNVSTMAPVPLIALDHVSRIEHWLLNKPLGVDAATSKVQLFWEDAAWSGIFKFDSLGVAKWSNSGWENANCYGSCPPNWTASTTERTYTGGASGNVAGTMQSNTTSGYGPFTLSSVGIWAANPLPIELLGFTGSCEKDHVMLKWISASELNNDYYLVEKSSDGMEYSFLTKIKGAGTTNSTTHYSFIDWELSSGVMYYRLTQVDFDGKSTPLKTIGAKCFNETTAALQAYSNDDKQIVISVHAGSAGLYDATLFDNVGKKIKGESFYSETGNSSFSMDVSKLPSGIYFISVSGGPHNLTKKLFVE